MNGGKYKIRQDSGSKKRDGGKSHNMGKKSTLTLGQQLDLGRGGKRGPVLKGFLNTVLGGGGVLGKTETINQKPENIRNQGK